MDIIITDNINKVENVVDIHVRSFKSFFLTFLGKGFLKQLYKHFINHKNSGLLLALENDKILGFLAYSENLSDFYKTLLRKKFFILGWYSFLAFIKDPKIMFRLLRAFTYSKKVQKKEKYIELSSIGVLPDQENKDIGTNLINKLKEILKDSECEYIKLETDAENNEKVNKFYVKNNFILKGMYITLEGRKMNEYRFYEK